MRRLLITLYLALLPAAAAAQTATVRSNAPIFVSPVVTQTPLRVAAVGTKLTVTKDQGDWIQVEFRDPQFGQRIGWVQAANLDVWKAETTPMDLSVTPSSGAAPVSQPTKAEPVEPGRTERPAAARGRSIYLTPTDDHFEVYLSAALVKKGVPVNVTTTLDNATYVLKASGVDIQKQSTGSKFARCLFAYCNGIEDRGSTSVQLLSGDTVVWSYSVNKGRGQKNRQALAEAVAKHLKDEYFKKR
jgi:hypothetical protein